MTPGPAKQFDRDEALGRAMHLFWNKGYEGVGVTELLEHMQIGRQSMYDTFGNKRDLFLEALAAYEARQIEMLRSMLGAPGSPRDNLARVFEYWEQMAMQGKGCLAGNSSSELGPQDRDVSRILCRGIEQIRDAFHATLERARAAGELPAGLDPEQVADLIVTTGQGAALLSQVSGNMSIVLSGWRGLKRMIGLE